MFRNEVLAPASGIFNMTIWVYQTAMLCEEFILNYRMNILKENSREANVSDSKK